MGRLDVGAGVVVVAEGGGAAFAECQVKAESRAQQVLACAGGPDAEGRRYCRVSEACVQRTAFVAQGMFVGDVQRNRQDITGLIP